MHGTAPRRTPMEGEIRATLYATSGGIRHRCGGTPARSCRFPCRARRAPRNTSSTRGSVARLPQSRVRHPFSKDRTHPGRRTRCPASRAGLAARCQGAIALMRATRPGQDIVQRAEAPAGQAGVVDESVVAQVVVVVAHEDVEDHPLEQFPVVGANGIDVSMLPDRVRDVPVTFRHRFHFGTADQGQRTGEGSLRSVVPARGRYNASSPRRVSNSGWVQYRSNRRINMT